MPGLILHDNGSSDGAGICSTDFGTDKISKNTIDDGNDSGKRRPSAIGRRSDSSRALTLKPTVPDSLVCVSDSIDCDECHAPDFELVKFSKNTIDDGNDSGKRRPSVIGRRSDSSRALTLKPTVPDSLACVSDSIGCDECLSPDLETYPFSKNNTNLVQCSQLLIRLRGGARSPSELDGNKKAAESSSDHQHTAQESTQQPKLSKTAKRRLRHKRKQMNQKELRRKQFLKDKVEYTEFKIKQLSIKLEMSQKNLRKIQEQLLVTSNVEYITSLGSALDEIDYFNLKIADLKKIITIINSGNITKRLPRIRSKNTLKKHRKVLRSSASATVPTIENTSPVENEPDSVEVLSWDNECSSSESSLDSDEEFFPEEIVDEDPTPKSKKRKIITNESKPSSQQSLNITDEITFPISTDSSPPKKKRSRSRKKNYEAKTSAELKKTYKPMITDNIEDDEGSDSDITKTTIYNNKNHQWVFDLRAMDPAEDPFESNYLVVLRGMSSKLSKLSFSDLEDDGNVTIFSKCIKNVMFVQRCNDSQLYIMQNLQNSLHFLLGSTSTEIFQKYLGDAEVPFVIYSNLESTSDASFVLMNNPPDMSIPSSSYSIKMKQLAQYFIPIMISSKNQANNRSSYVINMGITSLKVHQHKRLTITGCQGPSLISMWSKNVQVNNEARTELGQFLLFLIKEVIPTTSMPSIFEPFHDIEREYLKLFANQLNITDEEDRNKFNIPAVSLLINDVLHPHCDSLNPSKEGQDYTFSITVKVPIDSLPPSVSDILQQKYQTSVPFCIVIYRRNCLYQLSLHKKRIEDYGTTEARKKICDMLSNPYSRLDYGGLFFTKHRDRLMEPNFVLEEDEDKCIFKDKMAIMKEAIDKCGYWSSLLHVFYMYSYINGLNRNDVLSFVLFFSHQCNTTIVIVKAMLDIMKEDKKRNPEQSLYSMLCDACEVYNKKKNSKDIGCKGGVYQRFSPSNLLKLEESQVYEEINKLDEFFAEAYTEYHNKANSKITPSDIFECFRNLQKKVSTLYGLGPIRSTHLIQLAALLGLIPLQYYAYMPVHLDGGTGLFWKNEFEFDLPKNNTKIKTFEQFYEREFIKLQNIYGLNLTSNMVENLSCILGRADPKNDLFYYLPWVTTDSDGNSSLTKTTNMQLTFRLKVKDIRHISLVCKSNGKESVVLSSDTSVLSYKYDSRDDENSNILYLAKDGHTMNNSWIENQYREVISDKYMMLKDKTNLPSFDLFYEEVCSGMYI